MNLDLDPQGNPAWGGRALDLPPKERAVLALLIKRRARVVSKQEFADAAWGARGMSDESLARCISRIRASLADATGVRIESVYGEGYRLHDELPRPAAHARIAGAAQAPPQAVEAFLHARQLAQKRTPAAMGRALELLRELVRQHPRYAAARIALAEAIAGAAGWGLRSGADDIEDALRQLEEAQALDPASPGLATARAYLLDCAWRYDEARSAWAAALPQALADPEALFLHGRFLLVTGDAPAAVGSLREAVRLHPHSALLRVTLARALAHAGDPEAAIAQAQQACDEHPDSEIAAIYRLGLLAYARPSPQVAKALWTMAQQRDAPPLALSIYAYALARCGAACEALAVIDSVLDCERTSPCVGVLYAPALLALGHKRRALALLESGEKSRCGVLPMALRDPANAALARDPALGQLMERVFGPIVPGT